MHAQAIGCFFVQFQFAFQCFRCMFVDLYTPIIFSKKIYSENPYYSLNFRSDEVLFIADIFTQNSKVAFPLISNWLSSAAVD